MASGPCPTLSPSQKYPLTQLGLVPPTSAVWEMSNQFTQGTCLCQSSTHFPTWQLCTVAAAVYFCVNVWKVKVPYRDHMIGQVCSPSSPPALRCMKSSRRRRQEVMERGVCKCQLLFADLSVSLSTPPLCLNVPISIHPHPPLKAKVGNDTVPPRHTGQQDRKKSTCLCGTAFLSRKLTWKSVMNLERRPTQNSQNYFKWKDSILT